MSPFHMRSGSKHVFKANHGSGSVKTSTGIPSRRCVQSRAICQQLLLACNVVKVHSNAWRVWNVEQQNWQQQTCCCTKFGPAGASIAAMPGKFAVTALPSLIFLCTSSNWVLMMHSQNSFHVKSMKTSRLSSSLHPPQSPHHKKRHSKHATHLV